MSNQGMETYHGLVRTPADAIILFEACRLGLLPRVQRRLSEKERQAIKSGSVFVWDEREAGMRRWTDGKSWSASRVSGSFLTYREMEGKRVGGVTSTRGGKTPDSRGGSDDDHGDLNDEGTDGYRYKPDGLMKQSFSITTSTGQHLHLISYYARSHPTAPNLNQPSTDPNLRHIRPQKGLYPESTVNDSQNLPLVTRGPMGPTFALSPHQAHHPPPPGRQYGQPGPPPPPATAPHPSPYAAPLHTWPPTPLTTPPAASMGSNYLPPLGNGGGPPPYGPASALPLPPPPPPAGHPPAVQVGNNGYHHPDRLTHGGFESTSLAPPGPSNPAPALASFLNRSPTAAHGTIDSQRIHSPSYINGAAVRSSPQQPPPGRHAAPPTESLKSGPHSYTPLTPGQSHLIPHKLSDSSSNGTVVPSINSLMNGVSAPPYSHPAANGPFSDIGARTSSPLGPRRANGPRDIPSDKIGFGGEDLRALRQLDRVFNTA